jgi:SAM-dependent methyltransferase
MEDDNMVSTQRVSDWLKMPPERLDYFRKQFDHPYRSTVQFSDWLEKRGCLDTSKEASVLDLGSGMGASMGYMARRFPRTSFTGFELNNDFCVEGNRMLAEFDIPNAHILQGDLYDMPPTFHGTFNGVVSLQTLSWLPDFREPIKRMIGLNPQWIAVTSLFYDGPVNTRIEVQDYSTPTEGSPYHEGFYNIYSLPLVRSLFAEHGFKEFHSMPFWIDTDVEKTASGGMGTYTVRLKDDRRLQISGPLLMSWYFLIAKR